MKRFLNYLSHLFGFEKLNEYERGYLQDKNIQGSIYLGVLTIALEVWRCVVTDEYGTSAISDSVETNLG